MKRTIVCMFCLVIIVLLMATGVQAQELREVNATEILKQIENGEDIFLENVRITGELNLIEIELETIPAARSVVETYYDLEEELKIVESKINIRDSVFEDDVDFSNIEFRKDIDFHTTSFSGKGDFKGGNFRKDIDFHTTSFSGKGDFRGANFSGDAYFTGAYFGGDAEFEDAVFSGDTKFRDAVFSGDADFEDVVFSGDADFVGAIFSGDTCFTRAYFGGNAWFTIAVFNNYAEFNDAVFSGNVFFVDMVFKDDAEFNDAVFSGDAYFGDVVFSDDAYFEDVVFSGYVYIDDTYFEDCVDFSDAYFSSTARFRSTEFNKVSFTGTTFTHVSLNESDFNQMKVEWSSLKDALVFDGPTYIKIIKNFREMEQFEDADGATYQYRRLSQANKEWSESKLKDVLAWVSCGYGVEPEFPLLWAASLIMVFTLVYWQGKGIKRLKENGDSRVSFWDAFYFSMVTFTTVGYGDWYPVGRYRIVVMIEGVFGWLLLALFIVTLANVMIRP